MIIDKLTNAKMYDDFQPRLRKGLQFLIENDLNALAVGTYKIDEDKVFVMIQEYDTKPLEQCRWESHYRYADIQYIIKGEEKMGYTNVENTKIEEADKEKDVMFLEASGDFLLVKEGHFAVFTPQDAHIPGIYGTAPQKIKKAVVKVLWD